MVRIDNLDGKKPVEIPNQNDSDRFDKVVAEAISGNNTNLLKQLYNQDPNIDGSKYLKKAASEGHIDCVKILAEWQIDETGAGLALASAAEHGHNAIVEFIMTSFPNIPETYFRNAISSALSNHHTHTAQIIDHSQSTSSGTSSNSLWNDDDDDPLGLGKVPDDPLGAAKVNEVFQRSQETPKCTTPLSFQKINPKFEPSAPPPENENTMPSAPLLSPKRELAESDEEQDVILPDRPSNEKKESPIVKSVADPLIAQSASQPTIDEAMLRRLIKECLAEDKNAESIVKTVSKVVHINPVMITKSYLNSLHEAAAVGDPQSIDYLISEKGVAVDSYNEKGMTPLMVAMEAGQVNAAKDLIERRANVNAKSKDHKMNVLFYCLQGISDECFDLLINHNVNVHAKTNGNLTALMVAAQENRLACAKVLIKRGVKVNDTEIYRATAITYAAMNGNPEMIRLLAKNGADVDHPNMKDATPLRIAVLYAQSSCIDALAECGADLHYYERNGRDPIYLSAHDEAPIHRLVAHGVVKGIRGYAAANSHNDLLKKVVNKDPGIKGASGEKALTHAARWGNLETAKILLEAGAPVTKTALNKCKDQAMKDLLGQYLKTNRSKTDSPDECLIM